eukprot:jgi/Ulvmu1/1089/UM106_0005.1
MDLRWAGPGLGCVVMCLCTVVSTSPSLSKEFSSSKLPGQGPCRVRESGAMIRLVSPCRCASAETFQLTQSTGSSVEIEMPTFMAVLEAALRCCPSEGIYHFRPSAQLNPLVIVPMRYDELLMSITTGILWYSHCDVHDSHPMGAGRLQSGS